MGSQDKGRESNEVLEAVERLCSAANSEGEPGAADLRTLADWRGRLATPPDDSAHSTNCNVSSSNCNRS
jgi:hypothetical protein